MSEPFRHPYTIALYDTDAAGVLFAGHIVRICHHAWEAFMAELGWGLERLFRDRTFGLPIVHIEADFQKPFHVGMRVEILVRIDRVGTSSVRTAYEVRATDGTLCATAAFVQTCIDPKTFRTMDLPADFRKALEART